MAPSEAGQVAYMLANGSGKGRADKLGNARKRSQWRLLFLSSGELSLADHMKEAKQQSRAGQEVRVLDIPVDGYQHGCFQNLHGFSNGKEFAEHLDSLCRSYYGSACLEFIKNLLPLQSKIIEDSRKVMAELSKKYVPTTASGQVYRAFNRFALIAVAGELASAFGITGWAEGVATEAAISCFYDWLRARGDMGPQEERAILSQVRYFFELHGDSRCTPWLSEDHERHGKTQMRAGYRRTCEDGEEFYIYPEIFKREISSGFDPELVGRICVKYGLLMPDSKGGSSRPERLPGAKKGTRIYRFTSKVLVAEE